MVRKRWAVVAAACSAALLLSGCSSSATNEQNVAPSASDDAEQVNPNAVPSTLVGIHIESVEGGAWATAPFGALRLWDNGTAWSQVERAPGVFDWGNLDGALATANEYGVNDILMVLGTTPEWAASERTDTDSVYPPYPGANTAPANFEDWDTWVRAVVTRYSGRIQHYQIWNEASYTSFWNGTPEQMAELTDRAYRIIKAVDPNATVVSASPALRLKNAYDRFFPSYLAALAERNWPIDVLAMHTYPNADGDPIARGLLIAAVRAAITAAGAPESIALWDTELNYGLAGPGPDRPRQEITGARAAGFVVRTYIDNLRYGIARSYWYIYTQQPYDLLGIQNTPGSDGEQGFITLNDWVIGAEFGGCTQEAGAVRCAFTRSGVSWQVAWAESADVASPLPAGATLVCEPLGTCQEGAAGESITLTEIPVRIGLGSAPNS